MTRTKIQNDQMFMLENELYNNAVIPSKRTEMWRDIDLRGKVQINGGIFGKSLKVNPGFIFIRDAVFILEHIEITGRGSGKIWFNSVVNSNHSFLVENNQIYSRFSADLRAVHLNIENAFIYGNVFCKNAIIKNCVIVGTVFADEELIIENSILGSFQTNRVSIKSKSGLLFPFAISMNFPTIKADIYYLFLSPFTNSGPDINVIPFHQDDIHKIQSINEKEIHFIFSPNMRIFDFRPYYDQVQKNIIKFFNLIEIPDKNLKTRYNELSKFERQFFKLIKNDFKVELIKGKSKFMTIPDSALEGVLTGSDGSFQLKDVKKKNLVLDNALSDIDNKNKKHKV